MNADLHAASKAASDHLVRAYHHTYGLPVITTNCSNNYGPYQFLEKLIPLMILNGAGRQGAADLQRGTILGKRYAKSPECLWQKQACG